jgi:prolyl-tRNA synthetase
VTEDEDAHGKLIRAGFIRQAHSGIFHILPLGLRVQRKVEALIDKQMASIGASKLDLSSISSQELWAKSGRLNAIGSELFLLNDRKETPYLLGPTHEEEITSLVAQNVKSYKELPLRLYQISRKYRDELRPRHGLLRGREFIMKDLYTFDTDAKLALVAYEDVRKAYVRIFDELKIPYLVAKADSGDMGGDMSHEFHFRTSKGEDHIISCDSCDYVANEELAEARTEKPEHHSGEWRLVDSGDKAKDGENVFTIWRGLTRDRNTLVNVWHIPKDTAEASPINVHAIKSVVPDLDPGLENAALHWARSIESSLAIPASTEAPISKPRIINLVDYRLPKAIADIIASENLDPLLATIGGAATLGIEVETFTTFPKGEEPLDLMRISPGDACPSCSSGKLSVDKAIELGHTFYLGTRYTVPLEANVTLPAGYQPTPDSAALTKEVEVPVQMGCYGIGVSRLIGAVADNLADEKGLNWPRVIAPYEAVIIPSKNVDDDVMSIFDTVTRDGIVDAVLDDRQASFGWKMNDADLVGYPVIVVVGRSWKKEGKVEVQCRRLGVKEAVELGDLSGFVKGLLERL